MLLAAPAGEDGGSPDEHDPGGRHQASAGTRYPAEGLQRRREHRYDNRLLGPEDRLEA
jgi:hypothetical protein